MIANRVLISGRFPLAVIASIAVTYALFYFMQSITLGENTESSINFVSPARHIEFIRVKQKESTRIKERKAPKQPEIQPVPSSSSQITQLTVDVPAGIVLPPINFPSFAGGGMSYGVIDIPLASILVDEEAMPVFRIPPIYPQRAAKRGIEGWVEIEFTITALGTVKNARVIAASPEGIFDQAALRAISRWKFKPKVLDEKAVERFGVRQRINFQLESKR